MKDYEPQSVTISWLQILHFDLFLELFLGVTVVVAWGLCFSARTSLCHANTQASAFCESFVTKLWMTCSNLSERKHYEMTNIMNSNQSHKSFRKYKSENGRTRASEYIRGGIRCHGRVSIPCWPVTPAVSPISKLDKRYEPYSRSVCQERLNDWYETYQTACGPKKGFMSK
jgi:hypothetical protein